jgi:NADH-quinone oxidoreductase subunit E
MFRLQPVGRNHVQLCGTTPCMLRGANDLKKVCEKRIGKKTVVTDDGRLSWEEVECLGACVNAPMVQINDYYYEDLTPDSLDEILSKLAGGVAVEPGTFVDRLNSAPEGGATSLSEKALYDGSRNEGSELPNLPGTAPSDEPTPEAKGEPKRPKPTNVDREETSKAAVEASDDEVELEGERPESADASAEEADDLKKIKGIGPKIEKQLNELGVHTFKQIASWTNDNVKWVDGYLSFRGRIEREAWIKQSKTLASEDKS